MNKKYDSLWAVCIILLTVLATLAVVSAPPPTLRVYGSKDLTAPSIYTHYQQPFDPAVIPSDSITFNPALIPWEGILRPMSADSTNIDMKKFLRLWYEPERFYEGAGAASPEGPYPTILVETTYMLVDRRNKNPVHGSPGSTTFVFPLAEKAGQNGLGTFDADGDGNPDLVDLALVDGITLHPYWKTTLGTIRIEKLYDLEAGDEVRFLDHSLIVVSVDELLSGKTACQVNITYVGNMDDDTTEEVFLGTIDDPSLTSYFERHNTEAQSASHPDWTWYARAVAVSRIFEPPVRCKIIIGKELTTGDTFYVNGIRYDIPAIEVIDTDGNQIADEFKYITIRSSLCKDTDDLTKSVPEESVVTTQDIKCTNKTTDLPLNPPFNMEWTMIDDINLPERPQDDMWAETANEHGIHEDYDEVLERIETGVSALEIRWVEEDNEPRFHTNLLERLKETFLGDLPPREEWEFMHVQTMPSQYTEFKLPQLPDVGGLPGDYLLTSSFVAPNSAKFWHEIRGFGLNNIGTKRLSKAPRVAFYHDNSIPDDIYVNTPINPATVRIYGEDDIGPGRVYRKYWQPFNPAVIPKDSVTFNPAIIPWDGSVFIMSADSTNADEKKFLRLWYEPEHLLKGQRTEEGPHPIIELESTYMLVDSADRDPLHGSPGSTTFAFPLAENNSNPFSPFGLGTFDATGDGVPDMVKLAKVNGTVQPFWKTTLGTIAIELDAFNLTVGDSIRFLDHKLTVESVDQLISVNKTACQVTMEYIGNMDDDTAVSVLLGTEDDPGATSYFDRHNNEKFVAIHPAATWYARAVAVSRIFETPVRCKIVIGKELSAGDTFYVDAARYDIPAIEVLDTNNDTEADEFKYITLRNPICKDEEVNNGWKLIRDNSVVTTQWLKCVKLQFPVNPPFNEPHDIVDDIDIPEINTTGGPADMFADTKREHLINTSFENVSQRIIPADPLNISWLTEDKEPRYHTNLLEILAEKWRGGNTFPLPPLEGWDWFHVQTKPDQYTEMLLPEDTTNTGPLFNDYLITTSWYALNSLLYDHNINGPDTCCGGKAVPRVAFVHTGKTVAGNAAIPTYYRNGLYIN
jgi:hypothetical protein